MKKTITQSESRRLEVSWTENGNVQVLGHSKVHPSARGEGHIVELREPVCGSSGLYPETMDMP